MLNFLKKSLNEIRLLFPIYQVGKCLTPSSEKNGHIVYFNKSIIPYYYMANPVLGKSLRSDWFFLGQDFAVRTVSMETVQPVYFCFGTKPANSKFATKTAKKKCEYCHSSQ